MELDLYLQQGGEGGPQALLPGPTGPDRRAGGAASRQSALRQAEAKLSHPDLIPSMRSLLERASRSLGSTVEGPNKQEEVSPMEEAQPPSTQGRTHPGQGLAQLGLAASGPTSAGLQHLLGDARYLVHLARGCDTFEVRVGTRLLGQELYRFLRGRGPCTAAKLGSAGWPLRLSNRVALGFAAGLFGRRARTQASRDALLAEDFTTGEGGPPSDYPPVSGIARGEPPPRSPSPYPG